MMADKATNSLVITAARDDFKVLSDVIAKLDVPRTMVYIEALIMEVSVTKNFQVGVEWRTMQCLSDNSGYFAGSGGIGTGGNYNILPNVPITAATAATAAVFPTGFSMGVIKDRAHAGRNYFPHHWRGRPGHAAGPGHPYPFHAPAPDAWTTKRPKSMSARTCRTRPGRRQARTNIDYSTYEYKDVGVKLNITPHINDDQFVRLKIHQTVTQLTSTRSRELYAYHFQERGKNDRGRQGQRNNRDRGIIGDNTQFDEYKVPCLGSIPGLDGPSSRSQQTRDKTNLFIFITPRIVRTHQDTVPITKGKREFIEGVREEATIKLFDRKEREKDRGKVEKQNETVKPAPQTGAPGQTGASE